MTDQPLEGGIETSTIDGETVVTMWGAVDAALRAAASEAMTYLASHEGPVVFDVARVTFIDSSGLAFVLQGYMLGKEAGTPVTLRDPGPEVLRVLEMIGMADTIPVVRTAGSAAR
ncbi:STAS domain-containing protein [Cellulomonas sp. PhB143]|uniref:STAS domain-containing protein n=1 Tax=Cellulomonas sp. PhB143 TaxID=2485186 RepID=UPI000F473601|nr:STAS domain-containing protein [Cellulomonas sp. PhB143]